MPSETKRVELCERDLEPGELLVGYASPTPSDDPNLTKCSKPSPKY